MSIVDTLRRPAATPGGPTDPGPGPSEGPPSRDGGLSLRLGPGLRDRTWAAEEVVWQIENKAWEALGYPDWEAMRQAEYRGAAVIVPRADRPELVARLRPGHEVVHTGPALHDRLLEQPARRGRAS